MDDEKSSPDVKLAMLVEGELMPSGAKLPRDSSSMVDSCSPFAFDNLFIHTIISVAYSLYSLLVASGELSYDFIIIIGTYDTASRAEVHLVNGVGHHMVSAGALCVGGRWRCGYNGLDTQKGKSYPRAPA